jgi:hypothetical protein
MLMTKLEYMIACRDRGIINPRYTKDARVMNFEELCALIETLPEPAKSAGQIIANAKRLRISKAECSPCERAKAEAALREWIKTRCVPE